MAYSDNDTYRHIHFAVMAIESGARKLGISGKEMHDRLLKQGLIHRRLIKRYEDLHTQSLDWVADDISETLFMQTLHRFPSIYIQLISILTKLKFVGWPMNEIEVEIIKP